MDTQEKATASPNTLLPPMTHDDHVQRHRLTGDDGCSEGSIKSTASSVSEILSLSALPSHGRKVGVLGGSLIMLNTVVGGGVSLVAGPYGARCLGLATFIVWEIIFGIFSAMSMHCIAVVVTSVRSYDFKGAADFFVGKWAGTLLSVSVALNNIFVIIAFIQIALDCTDALVPHAPSAVSPLIVGGVVAVVTPLACCREVSSIESLAGLCTLLWVGFLCIIYANFGYAAEKDVLASDWVSTRPVVDVLFGKGIPVINLSWTCQFNAPSLYSALVPETRRSMTLVGVIMSGATSLLYCMLGVAAYTYYGSGMRDDIMQSINAAKGGRGLELSEGFVYAAEVLLGTSILAAIPFFLIEARNMLHTLLPGDRAEKTRLRVLDTCVITAGIFAISVATRGNLSFVMALCGVFPANVIAWGMPGLVMFMVHRANPAVVPGYTKVLAILLMSFAAFIVPVGIISLCNVVKLDDGSDSGNSTTTYAFP